MIAEIGENPHVHKELLRNTVEIVTGICDNAGRGDGRSVAAPRTPSEQVVRDRGMELFCAGTHPFAEWSKTRQLTEAPRYAELIKRTQWWGRQMLIWGVHVHVGVSSAHKVMPIITSLLNHYPHLLALSASSPWWDGGDTGYASNRAMMFQQLPTAGLPFHFQEWSQFERLRPRPEEDRHHRPHERDPLGHPAFAASRHHRGADLRRGLQHRELGRAGRADALPDRRPGPPARRGRALPTMPPWHVQENKWRAARYGLDAVIILDADSNERLVTDDLDDLLNRLEPVAAIAGLRRRTGQRRRHLPRRARRISASAGSPRSTTAISGRWSTRWSRSSMSRWARRASAAVGGLAVVAAIDRRLLRKPSRAHRRLIPAQTGVPLLAGRPPPVARRAPVDRRHRRRRRCRPDTTSPGGAAPDVNATCADYDGIGRGRPTRL